MGALKYKILHDVWENKTRSALVILIIGLCSCAIGIIMGTRDMVVPGMQQMWQEMHPAMINMFIGPDGVTENDVYQLDHLPGVAEMEPFSNATIEFRLSPDEEWRQAGLTARLDYNAQQMNKYDLMEGAWPSGYELANGQDWKTYGMPAEGGTVYIRTDERTTVAHVGSGVVYDPLVQPATFGGSPQFYVNQDFYEYLVGNKEYSRLMVRTDYWSEEHATAVADALDKRIEQMDQDTGRLITDPNKHFFQSQMDAFFLILAALTVVFLILGLLLVYNTISAIISSQTDQIGIMKAIGGRTSHVIRLYFYMVLIYGFITLIIFLPIGIAGAWFVSKWLINSFGADFGTFQLSRGAVTAQVLITLFAPMLTALAPIWNASRITVREAISSYGLSDRASLIDRILNRLRVLSRLAMLTVSNTFRRKSRVFLLELALVVSGLVFMTVIAIQDSARYTFSDLLFTILDANITMVFKNPERIDYITDLTMKFPGVKVVEMWGFGGGKIRPAGQPFKDDNDDIQLFGVPLPAQTYGYQLRAGRWLTPEDQYAIVMNMKQASDIGVGVGDRVTVHYGEKDERDFEVVGLVFDPLLTTTALVNREQLLRDLGQVGRSGAVWIKTEGSGLEYEVATAKALRKYYEENHVQVSAQHGIFGIGGESTTQTGNTFVAQFATFMNLLAFLAVIIGLVGSIALGGALALSVLERRREIGVMRAIGASSWAIFRMFIGEALILGWLSWLVAMPLSGLVGQVMTSALGKALEVDLVFHQTLNGPVSWFIIITVLAILFSLLPARGATKVSVRESLAYQ